uniref:Uncharacterized protein n=1 Tax=Rhizophora mucronata TaxID=61149 RepID=A0A2P2PY41_RHIMU
MSLRKKKRRLSLPEYHLVSLLHEVELFHGQFSIWISCP